MSARIAIVTLAVGDSFAERWERRCAPNWKAYAERHGYDVICLTETLDDSRRGRSRSPAWQKCLVLSQPFAREYERIVWIDADVLINPSAPPITEGVPLDRVGAVDEYATPTRELHMLTLRKLYAHWDALGEPYVRNPSARDYYAAWDLAADFEQVVQTGVMVLSPAHHRDLLEGVYRDYEDRGNFLNYEMRPLSYELLAADVVSWLDPRFNHIWGAYKALHFPFLLNDPGHPDAAAAATRALHDVHCLHFAGSVDEMSLASDEPPAKAPAPRSSSGARRPALRTPVALAIFARPDTTALVLAAIRKARPERLLVFADGPREGVAADEELCAQTRALLDRVDWPCEVETDFADRNMGTRRRIESGLDWVFDLADEAIVVEDDCLPEPSFFGYCEELLARYRADERVFAVSGDDFRFRGHPPADSYRFSRYPLIWGWATWRRAWRCYDASLSRWPRLRDDAWLERVLGDSYAVSYWTHRFNQVHAGEGSWDFAWLHACWLHDGLTALPTTNLVSNLGFRADATHTKMPGEHRSPFAAIPTEPIAFPLRHPAAVTRDEETDRFLEDVVFSGNLRRAFARLRTLRRAREPVS